MIKTVLASLFGITGLIWFLQGINIIPGSFMTGDIRWSLAGIVSFGIGLVLWKQRTN
jgi:hypothetical protein